MLKGQKNKHGLVYSTNIRGYNIDINYSDIKVMGYERYYREMSGIDTNERREFDVNKTLRLITEGKLKKLKHRWW